MEPGIMISSLHTATEAARSVASGAAESIINEMTASPKEQVRSVEPESGSGMRL